MPSVDTNIELEEDVETVDRALQALARGDLGRSESLLRHVVAHTPSEYRNMEEDSDGVSIKF